MILTCSAVAVAVAVNHKQTTINDTVYKVDTVEEMGNMTWAPY